VIGGGGPARPTGPIARQAATLSPALSESGRREAHAPSRIPLAAINPPRASGCSSDEPPPPPPRSSPSSGGPPAMPGSRLPSLAPVEEPGRHLGLGDPCAPREVELVGVARVGVVGMLVEPAAVQPCS
jgi:hypothetical protein